MFARKDGGYPSVPLLGRLLALSTNIRLGWKGLLGTNTLAYCALLYAMKVSEYGHALFSDFYDKIECDRQKGS